MHRISQSSAFGGILSLGHVTLAEKIVELVPEAFNSGMWV